MKKVLSLLKPHRVTLIFSILFATVNTVMQLLLPSYTKNIQTSIVNYDMPGIWRFGGYMIAFTLIGILHRQHLFFHEALRGLFHHAAEFHL